MAIYLAIVVLLVISIGVYVSTRGLPGPWAPTAPCKRDSDCRSPQTCNVSTGACVDSGLPGLIAAAQSTAQALYDAIRAIIGKFQYFYGANASALVDSAAANMGITDLASDNNDIAAALTGGGVKLNKYVQQVLAAPSCDPKTSSDCGYYTMIMTLTPTSGIDAILKATLSAALVSDGIKVATAAFDPLTAALSTLVSQFIAEATAKGLQDKINPNTQIALDVVKADITQVTGYTAALTNLAMAAKQAGGTLYGYFVHY
jgi:hypothetical protein